MERPPINPEKIIDRLAFYDYRYRLDGTTLTVYLSMLCRLKMKFEEDNVKITSHIGQFEVLDSLELAVVLYALLFCFMSFMASKAAGYGPNWPVAIWGLPIIYCVICFIKTENMKAIIHNWIERDSINA